MRNEGLEMSNEKLKPCPFCGGKAKLLADHGNIKFWVCCKKCIADTLIYDSKQEAIESWNRRADNAKS